MTPSRAREAWLARRADREASDRAAEAQAQIRLDALRLHYAAVEAGWSPEPFIGDASDAWKDSARAHLERVRGQRLVSPV